MRLYVPAVVVTLVMRLRFVFTPISTDEGGYLAIARAWSHGKVLYRDVWIDRPQGILVLYRALAAIGLGNPHGVRIMAIACCLVAVVACGSAARRMFGDVAGVLSALFVAVLASIPGYEGFIANGELLSGAASSVCVAVAVAAVWDRGATSSWRLLVAAGAMGGVAMTLRQTGFDGLLAAAVLVIVVVTPARRRLRDLSALVGGWAIPIGASAVHGALTGWHRYWYAIYGYRSEQRSGLKNADWGRFSRTWHIAGPFLVPLLVAIVLAGALRIRREHLRAVAVLLVWLAVSVFAFVLGGQFFRHYWVIFAFPVGTLAGAALAQVPARTTRYALVAVLLFLPAVHTASDVMIPRADVGRRLNDDPRLPYDEQVAKWFDQHRQPGDEILAICAAAGLYGNVTTDPPYPYLWYDAVRQVPGAPALLASLLGGAQAPRFVAVYQSPDGCDVSGASTRALEANYHSVTRIGRAELWERAGAQEPTA